MYKEVWEAAVGEVLICERESNNASDRYEYIETSLKFEDHTMDNNQHLHKLDTCVRTHVHANNYFVP